MDNSALPRYRSNNSSYNWHQLLIVTTAVTNWHSKNASYNCCCYYKSSSINNGTLRALKSQNVGKRIKVFVVISTHELFVGVVVI